MKRCLQINETFERYWADKRGSSRHPITQSREASLHFCSTGPGNVTLQVRNEKRKEKRRRAKRVEKQRSARGGRGS